MGAARKLENEGGENAFEYSWTRIVYMNSAVLKDVILIRKGITAKFTNTILITSKYSYPSPDFIEKALSIEDKDVEIQHTWTKPENSKMMWSGSIAFFMCFSDCKKAADHIVRNFHDIQVIWFPDFINLLTTAERSHKLFHVGVSKVIIKGRRSFEKEEILNFKTMIKMYGELKRIKFLEGTTEFGKIAELEYRFVTHAFVAKFHLHGSVYSSIGFLHAEVDMTEKEKSVQNEVLRRFSEHINSSS